MKKKSENIKNILDEIRKYDINFQIKEKYHIILNKDIVITSCKVKHNLPILFYNCSIKICCSLKEKIFKNKLYFYKSKILCDEVHIEKYVFKKSITFNSCEINNFRSYNNTLVKNMNFLYCQVKFMDIQENKFEKYFFIKNCTIENIELWKNRFKNRCYFVDSEFGDKNNESAKINFSNAHFQYNIYFNNSKFYNCADFHECEFEKIACFYGVTFEKAPNFSQVVLKDNFNALNTTSNFCFDDLKVQIEKECKNFYRNTQKLDKKPLDEFANDLRDSFRIFKSALIKDNNLLDASNFHKYELYCKEIELKQNWDKKGIEPQNQQDLEKNTWRVKELADFLLLRFYRKLCDHHTDFLKVFNNFVLLIALYALFVFLIGYEIKPYKTNVYNNDLSKVNFLIEFKNKILNSSFIQNYYGHILILFCIFCIISMIIMFYRIFKNVKIEFKIIKNIVFKNLLIDILDLFMYLFSLLVILIYINIYIPNNQNNLYIISNIGIFFAFCIFYLWMVCLNSLFLRYCLVCISYIIAIIAIGYNIAILNPLIGKLMGYSIKLDNNFFIMTTFAYNILMFLVLFSLQKTARKNSIVPS